MKALSCRIDSKKRRHKFPVKRIGPSYYIQTGYPYVNGIYRIFVILPDYEVVCETNPSTLLSLPLLSP